MADPNPINTPVPTRPMPSRSTSRSTLCCAAPSAIRTPISRLRWFTEYAIKP
jgi:hypothetical protein